MYYLKLGNPITITTLEVNDSTGQSHDYFSSIQDSIVIDQDDTNGTITVPVTLVNNNLYNGWGEITVRLATEWIILSHQVRF